MVPRLRDGFYRLVFTDRDGTALDAAETVALFRNGRAFGSDSLGGVFSGEYRKRERRDGADLYGQVLVPEQSVLVTGRGTDRAMLAISFRGSLTSTAQALSGEIDIDGAAVMVQLTFMGDVAHERQRRAGFF